MLLATAEQMRIADRMTIEEVGLPGIALMENAAQGAARVLIEALGEVSGVDVAAFCGRGNNGGDGLAICRILAGRGAMCTAYLFCRRGDVSGDAAVNLKVAEACGVVVVEVPDEDAFEGVRDDMEEHEVYVDAMLGTGLNSEVRGRYALAIELLNGLGAPVLAVDVPSGLCADTGRPLGAAVRADLTASFGMCKLGLALEPGEYVGELHLVDISIPPAIAESLGVSARLIDQELAWWCLPARPASGHKGTFGHLMVAGGSPGKSGALCLAAMGGLRAGAGLVTAALPAGLNLVAETRLTAAMSQPLPEAADGGLSSEALPVLLELAGRRQALVLGPGLGTGAEAASLARELARRCPCPLVIDADGLNALAGEVGKDRFGPESVVLTPHPGEAARLLECTTAEVQADRAAAARRLAALTGAVMVLKGARTVVAEPSGQIWVNPTGNALLASGGSGDVLAGVIGGLMAQGASALAAACAGVFVHGLASDLAEADYGLRGLAAEELLDYLPPAFAALESPDEDDGAEDEA